MTPDPDMPPSDDWQDMADFYTMFKTACIGVALIVAIAAIATGAV